MALKELLETNPDWPGSLTNQQALDWLKELVSSPVYVTAAEVRAYLITQVNGMGAAQRSTLDALREYAEEGTVAGASAGETAPEARRSGAKAILEMMRYGGDQARFSIHDPTTRALFTSLGTDGGNGPSVFTSAQLSALEALGEETVPRWRANGVRGYGDDASWLHHIQQARP